MICWDWIGFVTVRSVTFCMRSTSGIMNRIPGSRTLRMLPEAEHHAPLVLTDDRDTETGHVLER